MLGGKCQQHGSHHSWVSDHNLRVGVWRIKELGGDSRLKHDIPNTMSRVCHYLLLKGDFKEAQKDIFSRHEWYGLTVFTAQDSTLVDGQDSSSTATLTRPPQTIHLSPLKQEIILFRLEWHLPVPLYLCHVLPLGLCLWRTATPCLSNAWPVIAWLRDSRKQLLVLLFGELWHC